MHIKSLSLIVLDTNVLFQSYARMPLGKLLLIMVKETGVEMTDREIVTFVSRFIKDTDRFI